MAYAEVAPGRSGMRRRRRTRHTKNVKHPPFASRQYMFDLHVSALQNFANRVQDCTLDPEDRCSHVYEILWLAAGEFANADAGKQKKWHPTFYNFCCRKVAERLQLATRPGEASVSSRGRRYLRRLVCLLNGNAENMTDDQIIFVIDGHITKDRQTTDMLLRLIRGGVRLNEIDGASDSGDMTEYIGGKHEEGYESVQVKVNLDIAKCELCENACVEEQVCSLCDPMFQNICPFYMFLLSAGLQQWYLGDVGNAELSEPLSLQKIRSLLGISIKDVKNGVEKARRVMRKILA